MSANPELYKQMSKPYQSINEATKNVDKFVSGVRKLREKYRIAEVVLVSQVYIENAEEVLAQRSSQTFGDFNEHIKLSRAMADALVEKLIIELNNALQFAAERLEREGKFSNDPAAQGLKENPQRSCK
jgi:hypothetical protein